MSPRHAQDRPPTADLVWLLGLLLRPDPDRSDTERRATATGHLRAGRGPADSHRFRAIPSVRRPRLLLVGDVPGSAIVSRTTATNAAARARHAAARVLATPPGRRLAGTTVHVAVDGPVQSLRDHLGAIVGVPSPALVVRPGNPDRPNRKPIVEVLDRAGHPVAYAKIGWNALTRRLVRAEAAALGLHDDPGGVLRTPTVLDAGAWAGLDVLVTAAVPIVGSAPLRDVQHAAVLLEIGRRGVGLVTADLDATPWWHALVTRHAALDAPIRGDDGAVVRRAVSERWTGALQAARAAVAARHGSDSVVTGSWHGDWTPWNLQVANAGDTTVVHAWDWERSHVGVPLGLDALHHAFQTALFHGRPDVDRALRAMRRQGRAVVDLLDRNDPDLLERVYLLELATRWAEDVDLPSGRWLRPHLARLLDELTGPVDAPARPHHRAA